MARSALWPLYSAALAVYTLDMSQSEDPITKRQLGLGLAVFGAVGTAAALAIDLLEVGREGGIGPAQALALGIAAAVLLVGLSLIPLGDAPA